MCFPFSSPGSSGASPANINVSSDGDICRTSSSLGLASETRCPTSRRRRRPAPSCRSAGGPSELWSMSSSSTPPAVPAVSTTRCGRWWRAGGGSWSTATPCFSSHPRQRPGPQHPRHHPPPPPRRRLRRHAAHSLPEAGGGSSYDGGCDRRELPQPRLRRRPQDSLRRQQRPQPLHGGGEAPAASARHQASPQWSRRSTCSPLSVFRVNVLSGSSVVSPSTHVQ